MKYRYWMLWIYLTFTALCYVFCNLCFSFYINLSVVTNDCQLTDQQSLIVNHSSFSHDTPMTFRNTKIHILFIMHKWHRDIIVLYRTMLSLWHHCNITVIYMEYPRCVTGCRAINKGIIKRDFMYQNLQNQSFYKVYSKNINCLTDLKVLESIWPI